MKKYIVILLVIVLTSGIVIAQHYRTRQPVTVSDYYLDGDGYLRVVFNINREDVSGTFTWAATYEHRRIPQTMRAHGSWYRGDTSVDDSMYVGGEIVMRSVRVVRVDVNER